MAHAADHRVQSYRNISEIDGLTEGGVVSFVGAGGKTSCMFRLAEEAAKKKHKVLTTTTTRILVPEPSQSLHVFTSQTVKQLVKVLEGEFAGAFHVTAAKSSDGYKLAGYSVLQVDELADKGMFDWLLVEADGAAGKPLKAPAAHEPVVPERSRAVVGVIGLDCVGKIFNEGRVHRHRIYARITGLCPGQPISPISIARLICHPSGLFKGSPSGAERIVFLNKVDTIERGKPAQNIIDEVRNTGTDGVDRFIIGAVRDTSGRPFTTVELR